MSHRAIRRLRQEDNPILRAGEEGEESSSDEEEPSKPKLGFAAMMMDDDDDDSSESSSSGDDKDPDTETKEPEKATKQEEPEKEAEVQQASSATEPAAAAAAAAKAPEDLDQLLEEFKLQDEDVDDDPQGKVGDSPANSYYNIVTRGVDSRDLDIDYVMRTSLLGSQEEASAGRSRARRGRAASVFGQPRGNCPKPPHYVGGKRELVIEESVESINCPTYYGRARS